MTNTKLAHLSHYAPGLWIKEHQSGTSGRRFAKRKVTSATRRAMKRITLDEIRQMQIQECVNEEGWCVDE